jgi:hypothetical protein
VTTHRHDHTQQTQGDQSRVTATTDSIPTPPPPPPVVLAAFVRAGVCGARLVAGYVTDHDGWCLTLGLPPGVTAADAQARRDRLVATLGWPDEQTWLLSTGDPTRLVVSFRRHPVDPITVRPSAFPTGDELDQDSPLAWPARVATAAAAGATLACAVLITHLVTTGYPPTAAHATLLTVLAGVIIGLAATRTAGRYWHGLPTGGNGVVLGLASLALAGLAVVTGHAGYGFAIVTANGLLETVPAISPGRIIHYLEHARWTPFGAARHAAAGARLDAAKRLRDLADDPVLAATLAELVDRFTTDTHAEVTALVDDAPTVTTARPPRCGACGGTSVPCCAHQPFTAAHAEQEDDQ